MINKKLARIIAREWCKFDGYNDNGTAYNKERQKTFVAVLVRERTRVVLNTALHTLAEKACFLPYKRKTRLLGIINHIQQEIATQAK